MRMEVLVVVVLAVLEVLATLSPVMVETFIGMDRTIGRMRQTKSSKFCDVMICDVMMMVISG